MLCLKDGSEDKSGPVFHPLNFATEIMVNLPHNSIQKKNLQMAIF